MITKQRIVEFIKRFSDSRASLVNWYALTRQVEWKSFADVRAGLDSADQVDRRTVFNIGGNKYCLIVRVNFAGRVCILAILRHKEYDTDA